MRGLVAAVLVAGALLAAAPAAGASIVVQGHRGGPYVDGRPAFAENTLPAFEHAADEGFVLELDVKLTSDRVPVVIHDATLDRTTNCTGPLSAISAAELRERCRADVLGVPGNASGLPTAPAPGGGVVVPTLAEVLDLIGRRQVRANVEVKNLPTDNDFDPAPRPDYAARILDAIDAAGVPRSLLVIQSFWPPNLDVAESRGYETSLLTLQQTNDAAPEGADARGYEWVSPGWPVTQAYVSRAHALGLRVVPYTLDRESELRAAAAIGVDEVISNDPVLAARVAEEVAPSQPAIPPPPSDAACERTHASRHLRVVQTLDPRPGAPRVFAIQFKQEARHVVSYASFRTKVECMVREYVLPQLAPDRPNVVAFNEDVGLATIATGTRGAPAREIFTDPRRSPSCESAGVPCGAVGALATIGAAYGRSVAAYQARFPTLHPLSGTFVATTDTFARGWMQTFSDMARRYGVYILGSNNQPPYRESTDPAEIATFADPDLPEPPRSVFVATRPDVFNEVFLWGPRPVSRFGPHALRNVVASNRKVPVTPIEQQLNIAPGPATGPDAIANVAPYRLPGTQARISFATSLPAFVYGDPPAGTDPCSDVSRYYMRCLDRLGANLVMQDEANPGRWGAYTSPDAPDNGAWQTMSWMTSTWRAVADPSVSFDYNVTPHLVGNLADLPFDGQTAITQRALPGPRSCTYVGSGEYLPGVDPERFFIGGETLAVRPFAGPKTEFLAMLPWVTPDAPRPELQRTSAALAPEGNGALENDYVEGAIVADLPFPPNPRRPSCVTEGAVTAAPAARPRIHLSVSPRRVVAGRRTRLRFRATVARPPSRSRSTRAARSRPVRGALVRFAGRSVRTDARGRATMAVRLRTAGVRRARASRSGLRPGMARVRVVRSSRAARRGRARFTG